MDFERALETQRLKLLRLLVGLAALVVFASVLPVVSLLPGQIRSYVSSLLSRIEAGTSNLVYVAARVSCGYLGNEWPVEGMFRLDEPSHDEAPSTKALLCRIARLKAILADLNRYARRWIRRVTQLQSDAAPTAQPFNAEPTPIRTANFDTRIERPPDKVGPPSHRPVFTSP